MSGVCGLVRGGSLASLGIWISASVASSQVSFQQHPVTTVSPPVSADIGLFRDLSVGGELLAFVSLGSAAETWAYATSAWTKLTLPVAPPPRSGFAVADGAIFGGRSSATTYWNDTWMIHISSNLWTNVVPANATYPPARADAGFCVGFGLNILIGGRNQNGVLGDCWQLKESTQPPYDWNWYPAPTGPSARYDTGITNHPGTGLPLLFGGRDANGNALADTWIFDGSTWSLVTPQNKPPARSRHALTYDHERRRVVLFGGYDQGMQALNDAWEWTGADWVQRSVSTAPTPRAGASMCYDDRRRRCALFGGGGTSELWSYGTDFLPEAVPLGSTCVFSPFGSSELGTGSPRYAVIGSSVDLRISRVRPTSTPLFLFGASASAWGGYSLPLDLGPWLSYPGCKLYTSVDATVPVAAPLGFANLGLQVPNTMALAGVNVYCQVLGELAAQNPSFVLGTTNALRLRIGAY